MQTTAEFLFALLCLDNSNRYHSVACEVLFDDFGNARGVGLRSVLSLGARQSPKQRKWRNDEE